MAKFGMFGMFGIVLECESIFLNHCYAVNYSPFYCFYSKIPKDLVLRVIKVIKEEKKINAQYFVGMFGILE